MIDRQIAALGEGGKARHRASSAVSKLYQAALVPLGEMKSPAGAEREREAAKLYVAFDRIDDLLEPFRDNEHYMVILYEQLLKLIDGAYTLGTQSAPDGRAARKAKSENSGQKRSILFQSIMEYLLMHTELKPQTSENFAAIIRPDILEWLRLPKNSKWPTLYDIKDVVGWVKRRGARPSRRSNS